MPRRNQRKNLSDLDRTELNEYIAAIVDRYLSYRPRSVYEVETYLNRKLSPADQLSQQERENLISSKITQLQEENRLNDKTFAEWFVSEKQYFKKRGAYRIKMELKQKGIPSDIIEKALASAKHTDKELLRESLKRYIPLNFDTPAEKQKFIQKFMRKGFAYGLIRSVIEELSEKE